MMPEFRPQLQNVDRDLEKEIGILMQGSATTEFKLRSTSQCGDRSRMLIVIFRSIKLVIIEQERARTWW
jgi:hypothetical protein